MHIKASTLDDLLRMVFVRLVKSKQIVEATRGKNREIIGAVLRLTNPLARLSHTDRKGKIFSGLGELIWYLSRSDDVDHISYYIKAYRDDADDGRLYGAYGPRIFKMNGTIDQLANVVKSRK